MPHDEPVTLAAISGAHGVTGEVRLKLFGEGIAALKQHKTFNDGSLTLKKIRPDNKGGAIARFVEVTDRSAAEALRSTVLTIPRETLPELDEGEYYHSDLLGLAAISEAGDPLGTICAVDNFGAQDVIEIERPNGKKFMIPMTKQAVLEWDDKRLVVSKDFADI
ncbi:ribosome maturation factor RimM [Pontixanthobacter aestiaquae]|uniref:Ribosome maturation factor RimM n=1 Tax=Pontixanthobacter aestiaquae TaxID=1509367 RepID=A0A844Z7Q1_9SPHN|nr:ribosome maturation factor RimM [Pontixanthobacter aestiaquae]MDN3645162.1 ribosome maturation factor RimM [Pontixanthobacter aestiaquae]MXO83838.1 16S rRNA processing protein RimM [Pontixanthobacter aestiaquae]